MPKPYRIILAVSICLALGLFVHDAVYDNPGGHYLVSNMIADLLFAGTVYTGIFFGLMTGAYYLVRQIFRNREN